MIAVTLDFPNDTVVTWQSTFNNTRYGLGERLLGSDGTIEHVAGATDMVIGKSEESIRYCPEKSKPSGWIDADRKQPGSESHGELDRLRADSQDSKRLGGHRLPVGDRGTYGQSVLPSETTRHVGDGEFG